MKHSFDISLSGNIIISYRDVVLVGELQYSLMNLLLTDSKLKTVVRALNLSYAQAVNILKEMNEVAPEPVIEIVVRRNGNEFYVNACGKRLMNAFAQKKFELSSFLQKSNTQLGVVFNSGLLH